MSPLAELPLSVIGFPSLQLESGSRLFRIHRAGLGPWWFSSDGSGRFDLPAASGLGTCYLAEEAAGCFLEVFRDWLLVPEAEVDARRISEIEMPEAARLADGTASRSREYGITAEIRSAPDYAVTRAWAAAFQAAGFAGVRYFLRHDPGQMLTGVALFGPAGEPERPPAASARRRISRDVVDEVEGRFGIRFLPAP